MGVNPLFQAVIMGLVRYALIGVASALVTRGIITTEQSTEILVGIGIAAATIAWMWISKNKDRFKKLLGLTMPAGTTEAQLEAAAKDPEVRQEVTVPTTTTAPPTITQAGIDKAMLK